MKGPRCPGASLAKRDPGVPKGGTQVSTGDPGVPQGGTRVSGPHPGPRGVTQVSIITLRRVGPLPRMCQAPPTAAGSWVIRRGRGWDANEGAGERWENGVMGGVAKWRGPEGRL